MYPIHFSAQKRKEIFAKNAKDNEFFVPTLSLGKLPKPCPLSSRRGGGERTAWQGRKHEDNSLTI